MNESKKYPRSLHAQISLGTTSDDRFHANGYVDVFSKKNLVCTEKGDGQNDCFNKHGVFARSHAATSNHPWDKPMWDRWQLIKNDLGELEIFGENMYAIHSIEYSKLESFFYVFGVREQDRWLSWEEVKFYANMLDFPTVPELKFEKSLSSFVESYKDENEALSNWFKENLGMSWEDYVNTEGLLGGFDPSTGEPCNEGFVVRDREGFKVNEGLLPVADNEFDSLFKIVRKKHVKTDVHWTKTWKPAKLLDYDKYKWYGHEHLNIKK